MQVLQLTCIDAARRSGHQTGRGLSLRERYYVANGVCADHHHHQAIDAQRDTTMRWATVTQSVDQEAELDLCFLTHGEHLEHRLLRFRFMNADRPAAQLVAIQHYIVSPRARCPRVFAHGLDGSRRAGERMMDRLEGAIPPLLEHRPIHHPAGRPAVVHQPQVLTQLISERAERVIHHRGTIRSKEHHVPRLCATTIQHVGNHLFGEKFENRRLQSVNSRIAIVDLDVGETTRAVTRDEFRVIVDHFARQGCPVRRP